MAVAKNAILCTHATSVRHAGDQPERSYLGASGTRPSRSPSTPTCTPFNGQAASAARVTPPAGDAPRQSPLSGPPPRTWTRDTSGIDAHALPGSALNCTRLLIAPGSLPDSRWLRAQEARPTDELAAPQNQVVGEFARPSRFLCHTCRDSPPRGAPREQFRAAGRHAARDRSAQDHRDDSPWRLTPAARTWPRRRRTIR
jgi:hypothetical protein